MFNILQLCSPYAYTMHKGKNTNRHHKHKPLLCLLASPNRDHDEWIDFSLKKDFCKLSFFFCVSCM